MEYPDPARRYREAELLNMQTSIPPKHAQPRTLGLGLRVATLGAAWAIAYLITIPAGGPFLVFYVHLFPLGLCDLAAMFGARSNEARAWTFGLGWVALGFLSGATLLVRQQRAHTAVWTTLLLLLVLTAGGCYVSVGNARQAAMTLP